MPGDSSASVIHRTSIVSRGIDERSSAVASCSAPLSSLLLVQDCSRGLGRRVGQNAHAILILCAQERDEARALPLQSTTDQALSESYSVLLVLQCTASCDRAWQPTLGLATPALPLPWDLCTDRWPAGIAGTSDSCFWTESLVAVAKRLHTGTQNLCKVGDESTETSCPLRKARKRLAVGRGAS